jgi:maltose O-acetyltransferase
VKGCYHKTLWAARRRHVAVTRRSNRGMYGGPPALCSDRRLRPWRIGSKVRHVQRILSALRRARLDIGAVVRDLPVNVLGASPLVPMLARTWLMRRLGFELAQGAKVSPRCFFGGKVSLGPRAFVNYDCFFEAVAPITIGGLVNIGPGVRILTSVHEIGPSAHRAGASRPQAVVIGDGVWIGAGVTILPGVTIGEGCVIAAGAVVQTSCDPNGLYAGVPAVRRRDL